MGRYSKGRVSRLSADAPMLQPVQKIEVEEKNVRLRMILTAVFIAIAVGAAIFLVLSLRDVNNGWQDVEIDPAAGYLGQDEFVFSYNFGAGDLSAETEFRLVRTFYTDTLRECRQIFSADTETAGLNNVAYLNAHPNETVQVPPLLYDAFRQMAQANGGEGNRSYCLAPIYALYDDLFGIETVSERAKYDPVTDPELSVRVAEWMRFISDPDHIRVELLGDDRVCLHVSAEYQRFAEANDGRYLDFSRHENAFIIDRLAEVLTENGLTNGVLSTYDGLVRNLDASGTDFSLNLFDRIGTDVNFAAVMRYHGPAAVVQLRDFMVDEHDFYRYAEIPGADGSVTIRTGFLDTKDGRDRTAFSDLTVFSRSLSCAALLLRAEEEWIAGKGTVSAAEAAERLDAAGIYAVIGAGNAPELAAGTAPDGVTVTPAVIEGSAAVYRVVGK